MDESIFDYVGSFKWEGIKYEIIYSAEGNHRLMNFFAKFTDQVACFTFDEDVICKMSGDTVAEMAKNTLIASMIIKDSATLFKMGLIGGVRVYDLDIWDKVIVPAKNGEKVNYRIIADHKRR